MRHLFIRGGYKPLGVSGEAMIEALGALRPEIYGSITDPERVELDGLLYVFQRLPKGIEMCRYIKLITKEGFENDFTPIIPPRRRRNCYHIEKEEMYIEMTRGPQRYLRHPHAPDLPVHRSRQNSQEQRRH
jgi:hypothetical protein